MDGGDGGGDVGGGFGGGYGDPGYGYGDAVGGGADRGADLLSQLPPTPTPPAPTPLQPSLGELYPAREFAPTLAPPRPERAGLMDMAPPPSLMGGQHDWLAAVLRAYNQGQ